MVSSSPPPSSSSLVGGVVDDVVDGSVEERRFVALIGRGERLVGAFALNRPPAIPRWSQRIADGLGWADALELATTEG